MPGLDRTGPMGMGSKTGWGRGLCGGASGADVAPGRGRGRRYWGGGFDAGPGFGRGRRMWWGGYNAGPPLPASDTQNMREEMEWIKNQIQMLTRAVENLSGRMQPEASLENEK